MSIPSPAKRRTKGGFGSKKAAAQEWADAFKADVRSGAYIDPRTQQVAFREFAERWYTEHTPERLNTQRSYEPRHQGQEESPDGGVRRDLHRRHDPRPSHPMDR